ncbi:hypothetical protein QQ045_029688 [Rhodiola kirilowii]
MSRDVRRVNRTGSSPSRVWVTKVFIVSKRASNAGGDSAWVAFVYASNDQRERGDMWKELEENIRDRRGAWTLLGDINCIMDRKEKLNGNRIRDSELADEPLWTRQS